MTTLDLALLALSAVLAWEWRVARQDCRAALRAFDGAADMTERAMATAKAAHRLARAYEVWR